MKSLTCFAAIALVVASTPTIAQDRLSERPTIVVTGSGQAEAAPDRFSIEAGVVGRGDTQADALRALAAAQNRLMEELPRLEGLTRASLTTGDIAINPIHDDACERRAGRDQACPLLGYQAGAVTHFEGAPAERAGDAISLASELGAASASLDEYRLSDPAALDARANRAAFLDAQHQANMLAEASGRRIVRILRIQDPNAARYDEAAAGMIEEVVVTGSRIRQAISISVAPQPVTASSRITVVFEIE